MILKPYFNLLILLLLISFSICVLADSPAIKTAKHAYHNAVKWNYTNSPLLVVVDFTKPSTEKRFYIVDMQTNKIIYSTWVAHGSGSGSGSYATFFSNLDGYHASSLGVLRTTTTYIGKHGRALRLEGLERGWNDNVEKRWVVLHGANYIGYGKSGHSWGCLALPDSQVQKVINILPYHTIIVDYSDKLNWLQNSEFLK